MKDKVLERSLISLSICVLLWIILGIVFSVMPAAAVVIIGVVVEIGGGGALLYFWGKDYMARG